MKKRKAKPVTAELLPSPARILQAGVDRLKSKFLRGTLISDWQKLAEIRAVLDTARIASLHAGGCTWQDISEQLGISLRMASKNRAAALLLRKLA